jgi:hypothetical protein
MPFEADIMWQGIEFFASILKHRRNGNALIYAMRALPTLEGEKRKIRVRDWIKFLLVMNTVTTLRRFRVGSQEFNA